MRDAVLVTGSSLTLEEVLAVARGGAGAGARALNALVRGAVPALAPNGPMPRLEPVEALVGAGRVGAVGA